MCEKNYTSEISFFQFEKYIRNTKYKIKTSVLKFTYYHENKFNEAKCLSTSRFVVSLIGVGLFIGDWCYCGVTELAEPAGSPLLPF